MRPVIRPFYSIGDSETMAFFNEDENPDDFLYLIGKKFKGKNFRIEGEVTEIIAEHTALSGTILMVVLDTGKKIPVRRLVEK
jgi:hypothetical protein